MNGKQAKRLRKLAVLADPALTKETTYKEVAVRKAGRDPVTGKIGVYTAITIFMERKCLRAEYKKLKQEYKA
jgi:hypothetical protein